MTTGDRTDRARLLARVRELTDGTPYAVTERDDGFVVRLDLADARWYALYSQAGLSKTYSHVVKVYDDEHRLTITDDSAELGWKVGADGARVPTASFHGSRAVGRFYGKSFQKTYAFKENGEYGAVVDYRLDHSEGRELVRTAARELGWTETMPASMKAGIVMAVIGGVGAVLTLVVLLVLWLTGAF